MYIVLELQTAENGQVANLVWAFEKEMDAEEKYHLALAAAAKSGLPCHSVVMMNNRGNFLKSQVYFDEQVLEDGVEE